ncbi:hypothetical protein BpHYR1_043476 [Brachionus plicatilis]|uniref:Uncharacterized protein n=1 Tax=Brachionus plicatilis TaxID=10195 RepID=A0A3M7P6Y2_BRAPC|nr:hypothetical protein BpHYR1_043476 [Brachionus plicatilis]
MNVECLRIDLWLNITKHSELPNKPMNSKAMDIHRGKLGSKNALKAFLVEISSMFTRASGTKFFLFEENIFFDIINEVEIQLFKLRSESFSIEAQLNYLIQNSKLTKMIVNKENKLKIQNGKISSKQILLRFFKY